jgi:hypothetical protein
VLCEVDERFVSQATICAGDEDYFAREGRDVPVRLEGSTEKTKHLLWIEEVGLEMEEQGKGLTVHLCFSDVVGGLMSDALPAAFLRGFHFSLRPLRPLLLSQP